MLLGLQSAQIVVPVVDAALGFDDLPESLGILVVLVLQ